MANKFQSTLPVGGATATIFDNQALLNISIHAPRGGSDGQRQTTSFPSWISIHAPRGGSDYKHKGGRGARTISIHAPRGGSDQREHRH